MTKGIYKYDYAPGRSSLCMLDDSAEHFKFYTDRVFITELVRKLSIGRRSHDNARYTLYLGTDGNTYAVFSADHSATKQI